MDVFYYPPMGFRFKVSFSIINGDFSFQSVSGLTSEVVTETYSEGGQNQYDHVLPVKTQYPGLVLKRGLWVRNPEGADGNKYDQGLQQWFLLMMQSLRVSPADIDIVLLSPKENALMNWKVIRAWPKKWAISDFNAQENQVVIETMELHYDKFEIGDPIKNGT